MVRTLLASVCTLFLSWVHAGGTVNDFFVEAETLTARLSPDGRHVALIKNQPAEDGYQRRVVVVDTASMEERALLDESRFSGKKETKISGLAWIDSRQLAVQYIEVKAGVRDLLDTKTARNIIIVEMSEHPSIAPVIRSIRTPGWLVASLPGQVNSFFYARSGPFSKIYQIRADQLLPYDSKPGKLVKIDNGQFIRANEVASVEGYVTRWFFDTNDRPAALIKYADRNKLSLELLSESTAHKESSDKEKKEDKSEENKVLKTWDRSDFTSDEIAKRGGKKLLFPIGLAPDNRSFYCLDLVEEEERSIYLADFRAGEENLIYQTSGYKIVDLVRQQDTGELVGVQLLKDGALHFEYLDQNRIADSETAAEGGDGYIASLGRSEEGDIELLYQESHNDPGSYFLDKSGSNPPVLLASRHPQLEGQLNARQNEGRVSVEGLDIPYILTLPGREYSGPRPLIVMPHGGPIGVHDNGYFDPGVQYLASRGFAVLRVNFRGSSGYSPELQEAGKKQWGDMMLEDLFRVTESVLSRPMLDENRVCVMGMSYGGYASLMLAIRHPDLFRCAATFAGVTDLNLYLNSRSDTRFKQWSIEHIGDTEKEYDMLKQVSPVYRAKELKVPLLILHGEKDKVVDVEHSYRLKLMLDKLAKPYQWHLYEDLGHSFEDSDTTADVFGRLADFIDENI